MTHYIYDVIALNSFNMVKEDRRSRKDRESDTMAMLSGFKGALFSAKNPKKNKEKIKEQEQPRGKIYSLWIIIYDSWWVINK